MARINPRLVVVSSLLLTLGASGQAQGDPRNAHGIFTGEIKPVLYVSAVEKSAQETRIGQQRLYFRIKDLQAHRSRVRAWGGQPGEIKATAWMDMFIVRDPDGNEIVFAVTDPDRHSSNPWNVEAPAAGTTDGKTQ